MSLLKSAVVEDEDGVYHRASYGASDRKLGTRVTRRSVECGRVIKGVLRDPALHRLTCMGCLADERAG